MKYRIKGLYSPSGIKLRLCHLLEKKETVDISPIYDAVDGVGKLSDIVKNLNFALPIEVKVHKECDDYVRLLVGIPGRDDKRGYAYLILNKG